MLNRVRNAFLVTMAGASNDNTMGENSENSLRERSPTAHKFPYTRPYFLNLRTTEEIQASADHTMRPIIIPRDLTIMPWGSGYAEAINSGKSKWNEDQAHFKEGRLTRVEGPDYQGNMFSQHLPYTYFAMFDGHAGPDAAVAAANQLHDILHEKLVDILDELLPRKVPSPQDLCKFLYFDVNSRVNTQDLITGALESAFKDMDDLIGDDKKNYIMKGGCTAVVVLVINSHIYIANAGDSRAILCRDSTSIPLSRDHTPVSERNRVCHLAYLQPELLGGKFTHLDYVYRPYAKDIGTRILYRDWFMTGWVYKTVTANDIKTPVVHGQGKRSRVLSTIGVTRGFGDHDLKSINSQIPVKPFLLSTPEIVCIKPGDYEDISKAVIVMATDGLWDVTSNEKVASTVHKASSMEESCAMYNFRYTLAAQELVMLSRGKLQERSSWRTNDGKSGTIDDISVFVIPLHSFQKEYQDWLNDSVTVERAPESVSTSQQEPELGIDVGKENLGYDSDNDDEVEPLTNEPPPNYVDEEESDECLSDDDDFDQLTADNETTENAESLLEDTTDEKSTTSTEKDSIDLEEKLNISTDQELCENKMVNVREAKKSNALDKAEVECKVPKMEGQDEESGNNQPNLDIVLPLSEEHMTVEIGLDISQESEINSAKDTE